MYQSTITELEQKTLKLLGDVSLLLREKEKLLRDIDQIDQARTAQLKQAVLPISDTKTQVIQDLERQKKGLLSEIEQLLKYKAENFPRLQKEIKGLEERKEALTESNIKLRDEELRLKQAVDINKRLATQSAEEVLKEASELVRKVKLDTEQKQMEANSKLEMANDLTKKSIQKDEELKILADKLDQRELGIKKQKEVMEKILNNLSEKVQKERGSLAELIKSKALARK